MVVSLARVSQSFCMRPGAGPDCPVWARIKCKLTTPLYRVLISVGGGDGGGDTVVTVLKYKTSPAQ